MRHKITTAETKSRIPQFKSDKAEARWWETHSVADYLDEFQPVQAKFANPLTHILRVDIPLDPKVIDKLSAHAKKKRIGLPALIRMWILEDVEKLEKQHAAQL
jgi:hypothetical protein